jgi:predicted metal-dependent phosphoesterase TrpH
MKKLLLIIISLFVLSLSYAQFENMNNVQMLETMRDISRDVIRIPDIPGYKTLKCEFHIHTVFSDGPVWPTVRIDEAWSDGLDAIAITDHIVSHRRVNQGDHNTSYDIALPRAQELGIILIRGGEITKRMPPGHFNALFLKDANAIDVADPVASIKEAKKQGAFVLWNHPGWKGQQPDTCIWLDMHEELFQANLFDGIEIFNAREFYPVALDWCMDRDIPPFSNSDSHYAMLSHYDYEHSIRPMTLVFAEEATEEGIKKALFEKRTVAFFNNYLAGKEEYLEAIFHGSVEIIPKDFTKDDGKKLYLLRNNSDLDFILSGNMDEFSEGIRNLQIDGWNNVKLTRGRETVILAKPGKIDIAVLNLLTGSSDHLKTDLTFPE